MTVRREIEESPDETGARTDRTASPPANMRRSRMLACRSGESTIAAEVLMNNVGQSKEAGYGGTRSIDRHGVQAERGVRTVGGTVGIGLASCK